MSGVAGMPTSGPLSSFSPLPPAEPEQTLADAAATWDDGDDDAWAKKGAHAMGVWLRVGWGRMAAGCWGKSLWLGWWAGPLVLLGWQQLSMGAGLGRGLPLNCLLQLTHVEPMH